MSSKRRRTYGSRPRKMGPKTEAVLFVTLMGVLVALVVVGVNA